MKKLGKKGKGNDSVVFWGTAFVVIILAMAIWRFDLLGKGAILFGQTGSVAGDALAGLPEGDSCGDAKTHTLTFSVQNALNTSGTETFDTGYRFTDVMDNSVVSGTDSTAGSVTLVCGRSYLIEGLTASGAEGDNAEYVSVKSGGAIVQSDGTVLFKATKPSDSLTLGGQQRDTLEFRMFDVINNNFMYDNNAADSSNLDYETDGVNFTSTTNNATSTSVGSGGELHVKLYYRSLTADDTNWNDIGGHYVLIDAATATWNIPVVRINGVLSSNVKGQLNADEAVAYNGYEYVYLSDEAVYKNKEATVDVDIFALSGVNPATGGTDDVQIDLAARGAYAATANSNDVKIGSVQDNSAKTTVETVQDTFVSVI